MMGDESALKFSDDPRESGWEPFACLRSCRARAALRNAGNFLHPRPPRPLSSTLVEKAFQSLIEVWKSDDCQLAIEILTERVIHCHSHQSLNLESALHSPEITLESSQRLSGLIELLDFLTQVQQSYPTPLVYPVSTRAIDALQAFSRNISSSHLHAPIFHILETLLVRLKNDPQSSTPHVLVSKSWPIYTSTAAEIFFRALIADANHPVALEDILSIPKRPPTPEELLAQISTRPLPLQTPTPLGDVSYTLSHGTPDLKADHCQANLNSKETKPLIQSVADLGITDSFLMQGIKIENGTFVKFGPRTHFGEARVMRFIKDNTTIPVPEIYETYTINGINHIRMELIQGRTLEQELSNLTQTELDAILFELKGYVQQLRSMKANFIGSVDGTSLNEMIFEGGPFSTEKQFNQHILKIFSEGWRGETDYLFLSKILKENHQILFTHGDLCLRNIIISEKKIAAIVDWEFAGYYPEYWEYCRALDSDSGWILFVEKVLQPYHYEFAAFRMFYDVFF